MENKNAKNKNIFNILKSSKKRLVFAFLFLVIIGILISLISPKENFIKTTAKKLFSGNNPISSVEITTDDYDNEGSIKLTKEAHWINKTDAELNLSLETVRKTGDNKKDIVLVFDVSGSMEGEKLDKVKQDAGELIEYVLEKDEDNKVGLITFASESRIISPLTNDKEELLTAINNMSTEDATNYYLAYKDIETILDGYSKESGKDLVVLFMTDGVPTDGSSAQGVYESLKEQHPYITINSIEYEKGKTASDTVGISDNQWVADMNTLNNTLFEATVSPETYEKLKVIDYIDDEYFEIETNTPSKGSINVDNNKITWKFSDHSYVTGSKETLKIKLKLKDEYRNIKGLYSTNKKTEIKYKIDFEKEKVSTLSPILKNNYDVIYDINTPENCSLEQIDGENHFIFDTVTIKDIEPKCNGYTFKGWKTEETSIKFKKEDTFVMPEHDVHIRAIWSKQTMKTYMDGTVHEKTTLYKEIASQAEKNDYLKEYTGEHQDSYDGNGNEKIYHFYANNSDENPVALERNNVIFGDFCWQIVRTTDTGGVKLIYNGIPDSQNRCNNSGNNSVIGSVAYNTTNDSLAYSGYKYNKVYSRKVTYLSPQTTVLQRTVLNKNYYFANQYNFNVSVANKYKLIDNTDMNQYRFTAEECLQNNMCNEVLTGTYTFPNTNPDYSNATIRYVVGVSGEYIYYINLSNGQVLDDINPIFYMGNTYNKNPDGTYTIINDDGPANSYLKSDWITKYTSAKNHYLCIGNNPCEEPIYITSNAIQTYNAETVNNDYVYANDFDYELNQETGEYEYVLKDTEVANKMQFWDWSTNYNNLTKNHYTCFNNSGRCNKINYIYYASNTGAAHIELKDGKNVENAISEMLFDDDVNTINSAIKEKIDIWYNQYLSPYSSSLEDTIFCNYRSINTLGGWSPTGSINTALLYQSGYVYRYFNTSLLCDKETDKFSLFNNKAKLDYPVGLLTPSELNLLSNNKLRSVEKAYWSMSPAYLYASLGDGLRVHSITSSGALEFYSSHITAQNGVRPVMSLKPEIEYTAGDGTKNNPYVIDTSS